MASKTKKKLPTLKEIRTKELDLFGNKVTFRHVNLNDIEHFNGLPQADMSATAINLYMIAWLMHGYDAEFEERLNWVKSIEVDGILQIQRTDEILKEIGVHYDTADMDEETKAIIDEAMKDPSILDQRDKEIKKNQKKIKKTSAK